MQGSQVRAAHNRPSVLSMADGMADWIERRAAVVLFAVTLLYVIAAATEAVRRDLWLDEILTLWVAGLSSVREMWNTLRQTGADSSPPFFHLIERAVVKTAGASALAIRAQ